MKRIILLLMSLILLVSCLSGCKQENEQQDNVQSITDEEACEQAIDRLMQTVELPAAAQKDLVVEQVRHYDDESVVQYQQTFQGVDVYGSSVMVSTGKDGLCLGDYYDLSDAFGEDFEELVSEAERQPQWMGDQTDGDVTLSYRTSTLKPVILILPDQSAVIARQVEAEYTNATCKVDCTMVLSLDGTQLYDLRTDRVAYQAATVTGLGEESTSVVFENDRYYAYNPELNFYVYSGDETDANDHVNNNGATVDLSLMYFNKNADWTTGRAKRVFQAMTAYTDVATWYETVLGYQGIDGKGGAAMLVLSDQVSGSVAMNAHRYGYITYLYKTKHGYTAVDAPEILAHEYGHAVIKNISGTNGSGQTAALCEAICDSFGAAYCGEWHLAANLAVDGTDKDIPGTKLTHMDDYIYDTLDDYGRVFNDFVDNPLYTFGYEIYEHTSLLGFIDQYVTMSSDAYNYHDNAFIVSHTLYRIWDKVFNKNNDVFASVLYNSIRYLPSNANFSQFRSAFLYAARKVFDTEKVAYASTFFDVAGIASAGNASLVNVRTKKDVSTFSYSNLLSMTYEEIQSMDWDEMNFFDSFDNPGMWYVHAIKGDASIMLDFTGETQTLTDRPNSVAVFDGNPEEDDHQVLPLATTGMSYDSIQAAYPNISALQFDSELQMTAYMQVSDSMLVQLFFEEINATPLLYNIIITWGA